MAEKIIYHVIDLRKDYGQTPILRGITLAFLEGAKLGVIGPNGAGKSTLLRIIAGRDKKFEGGAKAVDPDMKIGYLAHEPPLNDALDVQGNLDEAVAPLRAIEARYNEIMGLLGTDPKIDAEFERLSVEMEHKNVWELDSLLNQAASALVLPPMDADVTKLSGGERRRVALAKLLLAHPDMLLLDEPTNHLDAETISWLEQFLKEYSGTVILITHDRYFLDNVVGWMLEIERGQAAPYKGNYSDYLEAKQRLLDTKKQSESRLNKTIAREREWLGRTPPPRQKPPKVRLPRYKEPFEQRPAEIVESIDLRLPPGPRLGDKVIEFKNVTKGFGDRVLIRDLSFSLPPGALLGIVGPNGSGKTTLLKMILGKEQPDSGTVEIGSTGSLTYLDQTRLGLDHEKNGYDLISFATATLDGRAYVARFNFRGDDQQKKLGECSGGMRNRVLLARMLKHAANVLLLDEPTNDLDLDTLRVLEEAIQEYTGSAIVVSHDRYFLNRVVTHLLVFEGDGYVNFREGTWEDYVPWRDEWRKRMNFGAESQAGRYRSFSR